MASQYPTLRKQEREAVNEHGKCVLKLPLSSLFAGNTALSDESQHNQHFTALKQVRLEQGVLELLTVGS